MISKIHQSKALQFQIFPQPEGRWALLETLVEDLSITYDYGYRDRRSLSGERGLHTKSHSYEGDLYLFDTYAVMWDWLKSRCNVLWPCCEYCGRRYVADEVVCASCGALRGDETITPHTKTFKEVI